MHITYHLIIIYILAGFLSFPIRYWFELQSFEKARGVLFQNCSLAMRAFDWTPRSELYLAPWHLGPLARDL